MKKVFFILFLVSCKSNPKLVFRDLKVGVHQKINICELIDSVGTIPIKDYLNKNKQANDYCVELNTTRLGLQTQRFLNRDFHVEVVDEIPPEIKVKSTILKNGDNIDDYITVIDNYDAHPFIDIKGDYDLKLDGSYTLEVVAVDQSANRSKKKFEIQVQNGLRKKLSENIQSNSSEIEMVQSWDVEFKKDYKQEEGEMYQKEANILGVKDIVIEKGTSIDDLIFYLTKDIQSNQPFNIDFSQVNTDVSGTYIVEYLIEGMVVTKSTVSVLD